MDLCVYTTLPCQLSKPVLIDPYTVIVNETFLSVYDSHRSCILEISLSSIVKVESGLYKHPLILDQQFPFVYVLYSKQLESTQQKKSERMHVVQNNIYELCLKTSSKMDVWDLKKSLDKAIRYMVIKSTLGIPNHNIIHFNEELFEEFEHVSMQYTQGLHDPRWMADVSRDLVKDLSYYTLYHPPAKILFWKSAHLISKLMHQLSKCTETILDYIQQSQPLKSTDLFLKRGGHVIRIPWIPKELRKGTLKIPPNKRVPVHKESLKHAFEYMGLILEWISFALFDVREEPDNLSLILSELLPKFFTQCIPILLDQVFHEKKEFLECVFVLYRGMLLLLSEWIHLCQETSLSTNINHPNVCQGVYMFLKIYLTEWCLTEETLPPWSFVLSFKCAEMLQWISKSSPNETSFFTDDPDYKYVILPRLSKLNLCNPHQRIIMDMMIQFMK